MQSSWNNSVTCARTRTRKTSPNFESYRSPGERRYHVPLQKFSINKANTFRRSFYSQKRSSSEKSNNQKSIRLKDLVLESSGQYKCEVSTEAPFFATTFQTANLTVICKYPFSLDIIKQTRRSVPSRYMKNAISIKPLQSAYMYSNQVILIIYSRTFSYASLSSLSSLYLISYLIKWGFN